MDELGQLSYSEKCRRFYLLSKYGEEKQEAKPPEIAQVEVMKETKLPEIGHVDAKQASSAPPLEKKPFEYYLRWDLSMDELGQLSYSEKCRRFYLLSKYGEVKQEAKPPGTSRLKELPPEPAKPMNLISDLVQQANSIDISDFQVQLLKLNHQLVQSHLKRIGMIKFNFSPPYILSGIFDLSRKYKFKQPTIKLDSFIDDRLNRKSFDSGFSMNRIQCYAIGYNIFNPKLKLLK